MFARWANLKGHRKDQGEGGRKGGPERGQRKGGWKLAVTHFLHF